MKRIKTMILLSLFLTTTVVNAQITKHQADSIVIVSIMNDTTLVAYGMNSIVPRTQSIITADGVEVINPFDNSYAYYIDDMPGANWAHPCRYCFVNVINGKYSVDNQRFYPTNHKSFSIINPQLSGGGGFQWPYTNYSIPAKATPNGKLYAVLIGGDPGDHHELKSWYNLSCVYTALVNKYGFKEKTVTEPNHVIVTAHNAIINYLDNNTVTNYLYDLNQSGGLYDRDDFLEDIDYSKAGIQDIFKNLEGTSNNTNTIPELTYEDQLFVCLLGHGDTITTGKSLFKIDNHQNNNNGILSDEELATLVRNIKCSQMTFLIDCCYSGGFVDDLMNDTLALCKNRVVHTCTNASNEGYVEQHITRRDRSDDKWHRVDEFVYYWTAASLGYYPMLEIRADSLLGPWHKYDSTAIGEFPWDTIKSFNEGQGFSHVGYDVNPDIDADGKVSMDEAFVFANNLDSFSPTGYFNPLNDDYYCDNCREYPQSSYESSFTQELITLGGYKGYVNHDIATGSGHRYVLEGDVTVGGTGSLTITDSCVIDGNNRVMDNHGVLTTSNGLRHALFRNMTLMNSGGDAFSLANCVFDTCVFVKTYDGPCTIHNCTFNETPFEANVNNPVRDLYSVNITNNTFNNTIDTCSIYLRKVVQCNVSGNNIKSGNNGIHLYCLTNPYNYHVLSDNYIHDCDGTGIVSYLSNVQLNGNIILGNNGGGLKSLNISSVYATGDSTATMTSETQRFCGNEPFQVYASANSIPNNFHYNNLCGNDRPYDTILYFESRNSGTGRNSFDVKRNCWNPLTDGQVYNHIYTNGQDTYHILPTWDLSITPGGPEQPGRMLATGDSLTQEGDYDGARTVYRSIVSTYPDSEEAVTSLKALFAIEVVSGWSFSNLKSYYQGYVNDGNLGRTADKLANKCDVALHNYSDAIKWYENEILNQNTLLSDRIFAEIDLGELYLEMEDEGEKGIKGTMTEYIPVSRDAHRKRTEYLLSLLPGKAEQTLTTKDSETDLICYPNPTTGLISLYFSIDSDSDVEISVYDMLGKVFKRILLNKQNRGSHTCDISLSDAPDGMYICMIKTSEGKTETRKIIVKH